MLELFGARPKAEHQLITEHNGVKYIKVAVNGGADLKITNYLIENK